MADVSVRMGVSGLSTFKQAMSDATSSVKSLDAQLKLNESQLKLNGDQEQYMANKAGLLKAQIDAQTDVVKAAEQALKQMKSSGVEPSSKAYKDMETKVYNATAKLTDMKSELAGVEGKERTATSQTASMNSEMEKIGQGIGWNNISEGLEKITSKLKSGAQAAVNFGKRLMSSAKDATGWADDLGTRSLQTGFSVEDLQRMDKVAEFIDTDVDAIINARKRMSKAVAGEGADDIAEIFGLNITGNEDPTDLFWELGDALVHMEESFDKEAAAQKVFGRSWNELLPLFKAGREEYEKMLSEQSVLSEDEVKKLGQADDAIKELEQQIADLKRQFWAENSETIVNLLKWVVENKNDVVTALEIIGGAFAAMKMAEFAANIGQAVNGFKTLGFLGGTGATGTGGTPVVAPTGTGGTGGGLLNTLTLFGAAGAFYEATEGQIKKNLAEFDAATAGMTDAEKSKVAVMQTFGWSEADWYQYHYGDKQDANGRFFGTGETPEITVEPVVEEGAASDITEQVGTVDINGIVHILGVDGANLGVSGDWWGGNGSAVRPHRVPGHANGLWSVPFDGYHAILHRGERVVPAREVNSSRNFSSNLYVESMYMNNGQDADGLAAAMAAAQRRTMSGYGS